MQVKNKVIKLDKRVVAEPWAQMCKALPVDCGLDLYATKRTLVAAEQLLALIEDLHPQVRRRFDADAAARTSSLNELQTAATLDVKEWKLQWWRRLSCNGIRAVANPSKPKARQSATAQTGSATAAHVTMAGREVQPHESHLVP